MDTSIEFDGVLTPSCTKHLVSSFLKYVLYQRGQIPFQFDSLKKYTEAPCDKAESSSAHDVKDVDQCDNAEGIRRRQQQLRESLRQEKLARRKQRNDEKLRKRIKMFLAAYDKCDQHLLDTLDNCSWTSGVQVALLLGSSPISPKEVYVLHFPATGATFDRHPLCLQHRRGTVQLFRTLVTCSPLLELTARQLAPTNLHVMVYTTPNGRGRHPLIPRSQKPFRRGTVIHIRLQHGAGALTVPPPPPAVSPCCGRTAPRRLQACCAQYAAEMGLALMDVSLSPVTVAGGRRQEGSASASSERRCGPRSSQDTDLSSSDLSPPPPAAEELAEGTRCDPPSEAESEDESGPMWCQIPVTLRGFRTPVATARYGEDCLGSAG